VTEDYKEADNKLTGTIDKVTIVVTPLRAGCKKKRNDTTP